MTKKSTEDSIFTDIPELQVEIASKEQTTRTTFNLSQRALQDVQWLSDEYDLSFREVISKATDREWLEMLAKMLAGNREAKFGKRMRKSFQLDVKNLNLINEISGSKNFNIKRDDLVDLMIRGIRLNIEKLVQRREDVTTKVSSLISKIPTLIWNSGFSEAENRIREVLGDNQMAVNSFREFYEDFIKDFSTSWLYNFDDENYYEKFVEAAMEFKAGKSK